jgi:hypothetical protein
MAQRLTEPQWVDEFLNRLSLLLPTVETSDATARALETFVDDRHREPSEAADHYALELPADALGRPGDW